MSVSLATNTKKRSILQTDAPFEYRVGELVLPVLLRLADVGLVAELGHLLGLGERLRVGDQRSGMEFLGLVGIGLLDGEIADLTEQERTEQQEQSQAPLELCRVATDEDEVKSWKLAQLGSFESRLNGFLPSSMRAGL